MTDEDNVPFVSEPPEPPEPLESPELPPSLTRETPADLSVAPSSEPEEPETPREPSFLGKSWPIFAAILLIAWTLIAVFSLLQPRPAGATAAAAAGTPA